MKNRLLVYSLAIGILTTLLAGVAADDYSCSAAKPCANGACCGESGFCGYGPTYCGTGCQSNCNAKAECGKYADVPGKKCPLNVCCSQYGFCGTTSEFCDEDQKCQSNCGSPKKPSGSGGTASQRVIAYFESWAGTRPCDQWSPDMLTANQITHLNFAFALIDDSNHITPARSSDTDLYRQVMKLKDSNPDLKIFISVGGWAFNDPGPSQRRFSIVASSSQNRAAFISSSLQFMKTYGFDGIDIDWEYPVDSLRGGVAEDKANFNLLMKEFRAAIRSSGTPYGLTLTTPSSYYYLRHFDVEELVKWIDWFNHMTYDLHGVWDRDSMWLGPYVNSHSNLTEIDISLDLFWRNKIPASKVSIGLGFYGRSFQLQSTSCTSPGCLFTGPANKGECTGEAGILSFSEIQRAIGSTSSTRKRAATVKWDKTAAVKYATWDDQWISYDDEDTFKQASHLLKIDYANKLGLGGMLIWAADQDDGDYNAMNAISKNVGINNLKLSIKSDGDKSKRDIKTLAFRLIARRTPVATAGTLRSQYDRSVSRVCFSNSLFSKVTPLADKLTAKCKKGLKQLICCRSNNQPQSCRWAGEAPNCRNENQCTAGEEELARDSSGDGAKCLQSAKTLCCTPPKPVVDALKQCKWFGTAPSCGGDGLCADPGYPVQVTTGVGLGGNGQYCTSGHKVLCCPSENTYTDCKWEGGSTCIFSSCPAGKTSVATDGQGDQGLCWFGSRRNYCCNTPTAPAPDPPAALNGHWGSPKVSPTFFRLKYKVFVLISVGKDEGCKDDGYRQWSSKLLDISGSWEDACKNHPAFIKSFYFTKPTSCDKSVFGIWGKFWVPDSKCCKGSKKRDFAHPNATIEERMLLRRACNAPAPGGVILPPNNPPGGYLAWSYADLLAMRAVRTVLQYLWGDSFPATNTARERGGMYNIYPNVFLLDELTQKLTRLKAFFFQHRTDPSRPVRVIIGGDDRSDEFDQRVIGPTEAGWYFGDPGQEIGDFTALGPDGNQDYVLIGRGLRVQPSSADHRLAWVRETMRWSSSSIDEVLPYLRSRIAIWDPDVSSKYVLMWIHAHQHDHRLVITRRGTYVAGPERRITRANANDATLTNLVAQGNPEIEMGYDMVPQNQIPPYDPNAYNPVGGNIAFTPQHVQNQLDEPTGSQPSLPDGHGGGQNTGQENTHA
ncbi:unnamed protein product [Rhizoctonia solani]|uniref:Chitinase n=1 Tax=Rhizoctonia solani TaxID=456999 RepID=A0A8H3AV61_9AGAM|nr:unnamed protein product [Rhizoctonia solani]